MSGEKEKNFDWSRKQVIARNALGRTQEKVIFKPDTGLDCEDSTVYTTWLDKYKSITISDNDRSWLDYGFEKSQPSSLKLTMEYDHCGGCPEPTSSVIEIHVNDGCGEGTRHEVALLECFLSDLARAESVLKSRLAHIRETEEKSK